MNRLNKANCKDGKYWTTNDVCVFIENKFIKEVEYMVISGKIHTEIGLINRHPMVCSAMKKLMKKYPHKVIDDHTQSNQTSTFTIKYIVE